MQRGSNIIVHFTLPTLTTEGELLKKATRLDLRIGLKPSGFKPKEPFSGTNADQWAAGAKAVGGGVTANGVASYEVPANEWIGKQVLLSVKIVGANGRDAGWSEPAVVTVVPPPETPRDVTAQAVPQGVRLTWQSAGTSFIVLRRGPEEKDFALLGPCEKPEYTDATAEFGKPYAYLVQTMVKVGEGEAQSDLSSEADITPVDTFAPAPPVDLKAVTSTTSIELVWERNTEANLAGYRVYRALGDGAFQRIADTQELPGL